MKPSPRPVAEQAIVITGASGGIGRQTALQYAEQGARLVLVARSAEKLERLATACEQAGASDVLVHPADVADRAQVETMLRAALARFDVLDTIVHCAAVTAFGRFEKVPADIFDAVIRTNVIGTANVARAVLPHFRRHDRGALVFVGSVLGHAATPYQAAYVMSKFAISSLARLLRQENRDRPGVRIHGVYPGPVDTPIYVTAANYLGWKAKPPPPAYNPASVATVIVRVAADRHEHDRNVGLFNGPLVVGFRLVPAVFDTLVGPLFRLFALTRQPLEPTTGNTTRASYPDADRPRR